MAALRRRAARHTERLHEAWAQRNGRGGKRESGRGPEAQAARRELEREVRRSVVAFARWMALAGKERGEAAERLGLPERLLSAWEKEWKGNKLRAEPRGPQVRRPSPITQNAIVGLFELIGPVVGLRVLKGIFPSVARRELREMLRDYREAWVRENKVLVHELTWRRAGAVWAMDYFEPPTPVDGMYGQVLATRDLASSYQPRALPFVGKSMEGTAAALESAFLEHGPPLVMKCDNDGTLVGEKVQKTLGKWGVTLLRSPPMYPEYNGSQEAGIGSLQTRSEHEATRNGRPGEWSSNDLEAARRQSNELSRPRGHKGPTPDQAWAGRARVTAEERQAFRNAVAKYLAEELAERPTLYGATFDPEGRVAAERISVVRALVALGYLKVRRRRIPPPISRRIWKKIK